jgi:putative ABC transport system permease protein
MTRTIAAAVHSPWTRRSRWRAFAPWIRGEEESLGEDRYTMVLFACFAAVALLLAAVGIYGLMAYAVSQRTQEIGLRLALGSGKQRVIWLILKEASLLAVIGLANRPGRLSALVGRAMRTTLYGVAAMDLFGDRLRSRDPAFSPPCPCVVPARPPRSLDRSHAGPQN